MLLAKKSLEVLSISCMSYDPNRDFLSVFAGLKTPCGEVEILPLRLESKDRCLFLVLACLTRGSAAVGGGGGGGGKGGGAGIDGDPPMHIPYAPKRVFLFSFTRDFLRLRKFLAVTLFPSSLEADFTVELNVELRAARFPSSLEAVATTCLNAEVGKDPPDFLAARLPSSLEAATTTCLNVCSVIMSPIAVG